MIEVFRTDVEDSQLAKQLTDRIGEVFAGYQANFDLEDCDRILRVKSETQTIRTGDLIKLLSEFGCHAEVLPEEDFPVVQPSMSSSMV